MPEHLASFGYTTWECRACELPTMFERSGPNPVCPRCGATDGWIPSTTGEMTRFTRDALEEKYG